VRWPSIARAQADVTLLFHYVEVNDYVSKASFRDDRAGAAGPYEEPAYNVAAAWTCDQVTWAVAS
jgi:hypothetical protein